MNQCCRDEVSKEGFTNPMARLLGSQMEMFCSGQCRCGEGTTENREEKADVPPWDMNTRKTISRGRF